jgi:hypothetical protein
MTDLTDFGGGVSPPEPPRIQKREEIPLSVGDKRVTAGWVGPVPEREATGFVSERDPHEHRLRALDAYGISEAVLRRLRAKDVTVVLIRESGTGTVLEFDFDQYWEAENVPDQYLMRADDPQRYVPRTEQKHIWSNGDDLYIPRDARHDYE